MPTSELERLLGRLRAPVFWLPPVLAFAAAVTFGEAFGPIGLVAGIPFGLVLGLGLGIGWHWLMHVRGHDREEEFAERTLEEARRAQPGEPPDGAVPERDAGERPSRPRDATGVAARASAMLAEGRTGEACLEAAQAIQMAVLQDDMDVALDLWERFAEHRGRLMLEPSTAERVAEAAAQRRRGRSG